MKNFGKYLKKALAVTLVLLVLCGVVYPLLLTAAGQVIFPKQANGSIVKVNDKAAGSEVVGQEFEGNQYFHSQNFIQGPDFTGEFFIKCGNNAFYITNLMNLL